NYGVFGLRFGGTGTPLGQEFRVNTYTTGFQRGSSVASDAGGGFVVVWRSYAQNDPGYGLFGQRFGSTGAPLGPEFRVNTYTTGSPSASSVTSDSIGNFVVAWESFGQDGSNRGVFGQRYGSGGEPLGPEFRVNTYTTDIQRSPSLASDSIGNFVVVWESLGQDGSNLGVFGQRYDSAGAPLGPEFQVNTFTTSSQSYPSVASDSDGSFVVAWQSLGQDGSNLGIFGQRYDSAGAPLGTEFLANTHTTNRQTTPSVASCSGGRFAVVWSSGFQDGSSDGVFGQRFCPGLASVTISVNGSTTVCTTSTGGTATVSDSGGGAGTHQWAFRTMPGIAPSPISGQTATSYVIDGADFPGAGVYSLLCSTNPECGLPATSNGITVFVTDDPSGPVVTSPNALTTTQTLCE
ncbi:MAG TPA: hypothetical protein VGR00_06305, partial [Thermoanaerobaculia bacterium]|nr:hypothetical protein [Thermoanaerobaculia bacterium]